MFIGFIRHYDTSFTDYRFSTYNEIILLFHRFFFTYLFCKFSKKNLITDKFTKKGEKLIVKKNFFMG